MAYLLERKHDKNKAFNDENLELFFCVNKNILPYSKC